MTATHQYDISQGHSTDALWGSTQDAQQIKAPEKQFVPISERRRPAPSLTLGALARFAEAERPWHKQLDSKSIQTATDELHEALALATDMKDTLTALPADQRAEDHAITQQARQDATTGERSEPIPRKGWATEQVFAEAQWSLAFEAAGKAASHLRAVAASEAQKGVAALVERAADKRAAALAKLRKAQAEVAAAIAATDAIAAADTELGLTARGWHRAPAATAGLAGKATQGLDAVIRYLQATDDMTTGAYVLDKSSTVPMHTRLALTEPSASSVDEWTLFQVEASEGWKVTDYTIGLQQVHAVADDFKAEYIDRRELPR